MAIGSDECVNCNGSVGGGMAQRDQAILIPTDFLAESMGSHGHQIAAAAEHLRSSAANDARPAHLYRGTGRASDPLASRRDALGRGLDTSTKTRVSQQFTILSTAAAEVFGQVGQDNGKSREQPKPADDPPEVIQEVVREEKIRRIFIRRKGPIVDPVSTEEEFEKLKRDPDLLEPTASPVELKCGGKWQHKVDVVETENKHLSTWADKASAQQNAAAAIKAVDADEEIDTNADSGKLEEGIALYLETRYGWKCETPCELEITLIAYIYSMTFTVWIKERKDKTPPEFEVWITREHVLDAIFNAECVE